MKIVRYITILTLSLYLPLNADETPIVAPSIKELLTQVKEAPDGQKRVLINQLKMQLKKMNTESRKEAMRELKKSFAGKRMQHRRGQHHNNNSSHTSNHQPKFRHLRHGLQNGTGNGQGQGLGNGNQGNGHK